jgi:hypothetical protein
MTQTEREKFPSLVPTMVAVAAILIAAMPMPHMA